MLLGSNFKIPIVYFLNGVKIVLEVQLVTTVGLYYFKAFIYIYFVFLLSKTPEL
jgi:hypothetical protein